VGKALKGGYRERIKLATKLPVWLANTYEDFEKYLDEQLTRLGVDYIDFYLLHALDKDRWAKLKELNVFKFLDEAKAKGKIKHAGFSFHDDVSVFKEIADSYGWDMCQIMLNIIDKDYQAGVEGLHYAGSKGIPVVVMEPLKGGKLASSIPDDIMKVWDSSRVKLSPVEWAFKWVYNFPEVKVILSGVSSMEQLKDNLKIFENSKPHSMSEEDLALVDKVTDLYNSKIRIGCTGCNYCQPCPSGVVIPDIFSLYNDIYMYGSSQQSADFYKRIMKAEKDASKCVECGQCESACPQHLSIRENLKTAHGEMGR
jgi:predicted aldo/keto reductase-like oxidoreductase